MELQRKLNQSSVIACADYTPEFAREDDLCLAFLIDATARRADRVEVADVIGKVKTLVGKLETISYGPFPETINLH
ncbi:MAG: hypothetical protein AABN34_13520 [Acidobacteriota bacterium]